MPEEVTEDILKAAFLPFGDIKSVEIPLDHRGVRRDFGFVTFDDVDDADAAIDNMHRSELFGRTIIVSEAKPDGARLGSSRPVWKEDDFYNGLREDGEGLSEEVSMAALEAKKETETN